MEDKTKCSDVHNQFKTITIPIAKYESDRLVLYYGLIDKFFAY